MILQVENLLDQEAMSTIVALLPDIRFGPGKDTAGWHARAVKDNLQAIPSSQVRAVGRTVQRTLWSHALISSACLPLKISEPLLSKCGVGQGYGRHVDDALMGTNPPLRSDISLTVFLNAPADYDGGELVIERPEGEEGFKGAMGSAILYPSTHLHRVEPVTRGERLVLVFWIQSKVREASDREILFSLDQARRHHFQQFAKDEQFDRLSLVHANLLRKWADI